MTHPTPRGVWLGASTRLRYPVPTDQPYPHVCGADAYPQAQRRDCAACVEAEQRPRDELHEIVGWN
jgi:hypothetical protein